MGGGRAISLPLFLARTPQWDGPRWAWRHRPSPQALGAPSRATKPLHGHIQAALRPQGSVLLCVRFPVLGQQGHEEQHRPWAGSPQGSADLSKGEAQAQDTKPCWEETQREVSPSDPTPRPCSPSLAPAMASV